MIRFRSTPIALVALTCGVLCWSLSARAGDIDALRWVPASCNAVAVVELRALLDSPLGQRHKWLAELRQAYAQGRLSAPPYVRRIVQATTFDGSSDQKHVVYSIYTMDQDSVIHDVASHELATTEQIAGHVAVDSPRHVYFVQLAPGVVGAVKPPDRLAVSRWVRAQRDGAGVQISSAHQAAVESSPEAQIVVGVDLTDLLSPQQVRRWLATVPALKSAKNLDELATLVASLGVVRLSVAVSDTIDARLRLDFGAPVAAHVAALKTAVLQWLDDAGARVEVLAGAQVAASGNSLTFEAPLDESAMRKILTLIQSPRLPSPGDASVRSESAPPNAIASAAYYDSVCEALNALIRKNQNATNYDKTAAWHENFARKIAELPTAGVDPELVSWGRRVGSELMALARSLRGVPIEVDRLQRSIRVDATTDYGWYATSADSGPMYFPWWRSETSNAQDVRAQQDDVIARNADQRDAVWRMLRDETTEVARKMESKYQIKLKLPQSQ
jgi:hypothetical protein